MVNMLSMVPWSTGRNRMVIISLVLLVIVSGKGVKLVYCGLDDTMVWIFTGAPVSLRIVVVRSAATETLTMP